MRKPMSCYALRITQYSRQRISQLVRQRVFGVCIQPQRALNIPAGPVKSKERRAQPLELPEEIARVGQAAPLEEIIILLLGNAAQLEQRGRSVEAIYMILL